MKKIIVIGIAFVLFSCGSTQIKSTEKKPLFEILTQQKDGGGNLHFFEIISGKEEFNILLGDSKLKKKIKPDDIKTANFIILNMGEKTQEGSTIDVLEAEETPTSIILTIKENDPQTNGIQTAEYIYPYTIVKINSKKEIVIK